MNYERMTKTELISKIKTLESRKENTDSKRLEKPHVELLEDYFKILNVVPVWFWAVKFQAPNINVYIASRGSKLLTGYEPEEFINNSSLWLDIIVEDDHGIAIECNNRARRDKITTSFECRFRHKEGEVRWMHDVVVPECDESGGLIGLFGFAFDITKRKHAEEELKGSEARLNEAQHLACIGSWERDMKTDKIEWSDEQYRMFGYEPHEIEPTFDTVVDAIHPDDRKAFLAANNFNNNIGSIYSNKYRINRPDGSERFIYSQAKLIRDDSGNVIKMLGTVQDVTDLEISEERFKKYGILFDNITDLAYMCDTKGNILFVNKVFEKMTGHKPDEFIGKSFAPLFDEENLEIAMNLYTRTLEGESPQYELRFKDTGTLCEYKNMPMRDSGGNIVGVIGVGRDITERKKIEEVLNESENKYHSLFEYMLNGFAYCTIIVDENNKPIDFVYLEVNYVFERLTGLKKNDIIGKRVTEAIPAIKDKNPELFDIYGKVALTGESTQFEIYFGPLEMWFSISVYSPKRGYFVAVFDNITARKKSEELLREQKKALEQKNIALSEILGQIEIEKKQIKDNVIANAENLLLPVIQKLRLKGESRKYVQLLRKNLQELTSSFGARLTEERAKLTSREIEVCNMIKNGLTSKEIAALLNISLRTTEKHRINIRRKLGIVNKDINLSSFLRTL